MNCPVCGKEMKIHTERPNSVYYICKACSFSYLEKDTDGMEWEDEDCL